MKKEAANDIISECYARSLKLLEKNSHANGVIAAARTKKSVDRNYISIFGRDAAICSLGMVASGNRSLISHAKKGLLTLARYQAPNGQIPKYVKPEKRESDFWYSGCIDATLLGIIDVDNINLAPLRSTLSNLNSFFSFFDLTDNLLQLDILIYFDNTTIAEHTVAVTICNEIDKLKLTL